MTAQLPSQNTESKKILTNSKSVWPNITNHNLDILNSTTPTTPKRNLIKPPPNLMQQNLDTPKLT